MTLNKLIEVLNHAKEKFGGDSGVKLIDREGDEETFKIRATLLYDEKSETGVSAEILIELQDE